MTTEEIAEKLLWPCWRGMPDAYKMRYARNIWSQFEDQIRSAAYTSSLTRCFETLTLRLGISIRQDDVRPVNEVLADADARAVLRALREETTALVLMVRLRNTERKEAMQLDADL